MATKPNVMFIVMDGLRPDHLSFNGYFRKTSPNIDELAKNGVYFEKAYTTFDTTYRSILSILTGRQILAKEFKSYHTEEEMKLFFDTGGLILQEILKDKGYKTYCFKKLWGWHKRGFDRFYEDSLRKKSAKWNFISSLKNYPKLYKTLEYTYRTITPEFLTKKVKETSNSEIITKDAISIMDNLKPEDNFFMWVDFMDTHRAYNTPGKFSKKFKAQKDSPYFMDVISKQKFDEKQLNSFRTWFGKDKVEDIIAQYDNAISYSDSLVERIVSKLKEKGLYDNTYIFFFSDHGESLIEHEIYFEHTGLYDVSTHLPLIIAGKDIPKNVRIDSLIQLIDIPPTVLSLLNIPFDSSNFDGKSLLPLIKNESKTFRDIVYFEEFVNNIVRRGIRDSRYKYVECPLKEHSICSYCQTSHGEIIELFDLQKDPNELTNLASTDKERLSIMKSKLDKYIKELNTLNEKRKIKIMLKKLDSKSTKNL